MKGFLFLIILTVTLKAIGQNEFAATAFYKEFMKVYSDARNGFSENKGSERASAFPELTKEYDIKILLPLADSGKIVESAKGTAYAIYYFEPDKVRLKVDQRGAHLRDAVQVALNLPLYAFTETTLVDNKPLTNTWYFTDPLENRKTAAAFSMGIFYNRGLYHLTLQINSVNNTSN
jgi:hypothetical protein